MFWDGELKLLRGSLAVVAGWWALTLAATSAPAAPKLSDQELSELAGETSEAVPEIQRARALAAASGCKLMTYGGTSREILDFVRARVRDLGSAAAYRSWLKSKGQLSLLDWHRVASDLDLMLVPERAGPYSPADEVIFKIVAKQIEAQFPGAFFYKKFDISLSHEFFQRYPIAGEHFEAISNIPISESGVESLPELRVGIGERAISMSRWGLRQYSQGRLEFRLAPDFSTNRDLREDTFGNFRQVLRWIRYASENPEMTLTHESRLAIRDLLNHVLTQDRTEALQLLRSGNQELIGEGGPRSISGKLVSALEKLQIYSRDAIRTRKLLTEFGIDKLCEEAKVSQERIFEPLRPRSPADELKVRSLGGAKRLGKELVVYHRTALDAAQNISSGALWKSNNQTVIAGKQTMAVLGPGLYASPDFLSASYGEFGVEIHLSADAVEGVDFIHSFGRYCILNLSAIARDAEGRLKIAPLERKSLLQNLLMKLPGVEPGIQEYLLGPLGKLFAPETNAQEWADFKQVLRVADGIGRRATFLSSYIQRPGIARHVFTQDDELARELRPSLLAMLELSTSPDTYRALLVEIYRDGDAIFSKYPELRQKLLELLKFSYWDKSVAYFFSNRAFCERLRTEDYPAYLDLLRASLAWFRYEQLPLDLEDPRDVKVLRDLMDSTRDDRDGHLREIEKKVDRLRIPGKDKNYSKFVIELRRQDPELAESYFSAALASGMTWALPKALNRVFCEHPVRYREMGLAPPVRELFEEAYFTEEYGGQFKSKEQPGGALILNQLKDGDPLTGVQRGQLESLLYLYPTRFGLTAMALSPTGADEVVRALVSGGVHFDDAVLSMLGEKIYDSKPLDGRKRESQTRLRETILGVPAWRARIRDLLLLQPPRQFEWAQFPWDLRDPRDVEFLQAAERRDRRAPYEGLYAQRRELARTKKLSFSAEDARQFPNGVHALKDRDPSAVREYERLLSERQLTEKFESLLGTVREAQPELFARYFPQWFRAASQERIEEAKKGFGLAYEARSRFKERGPEALTPVEQETLESFLALPIKHDWYAAYKYGDLISSRDPAGHAALMARLRSWSRDDEALEMLQILGCFQSNSPSDAYRDLKRIVRGRLGEIAKKEDLRRFPWDRNDPEDLAWLRAWRDEAKDPRSSESLEALTAEARKRFPKSFDSEKLYPETILDDVFRARVMQAQNRQTAAQPLRQVLEYLKIEDPAELDALHAQALSRCTADGIIRAIAP